MLWEEKGRVPARLLLLGERGRITVGRRRLTLSPTGGGFFVLFDAVSLHAAENVRRSDAGRFLLSPG